MTDYEYTVRKCCGNCTHYNPIEKEEGAGECRRYPPQMVIIRQTKDNTSITSSGEILNRPVLVEQLTGVFPKMLESSCCGEYLERS